jgi:hypothetical protein|eukprot:Stramenopile-MAST_4_protein_1224
MSSSTDSEEKKAGDAASVMAPPPKRPTPLTVAEHRASRKRYRESALLLPYNYPKIRKKIPYIVKYEVKTEIQDWDPKAFDDMKEDEVEEAKDEYEADAEEFDEEGTEPIFFDSLKSAKEAAKTVFRKILCEVEDKKWANDSLEVPAEEFETDDALEGILFSRDVQCNIDTFSMGFKNTATTSIVVKAVPAQCKYLTPAEIPKEYHGSKEPLNLLYNKHALAAARDGKCAFPL